MNYYDLLGVAPTATADEIRAAYRTLAQIFHPDRLTHLKAESRSFAEERLKTLNVAYGVLSDPGKRAAYDATLSGPLPRPRVGYQPAPPPPRPHYAPPQSSPQTPPQAPPAPDAAARRSQFLDRRRRLAALDAEITDLTRNISQFEFDRQRSLKQMQSLRVRIIRNFWLGVFVTGLGFGSVLLVAIGLFNQSAGVLSPTAQRVIFVALAGLYEYWAALTIAFFTRAPGARISLWGTFRQTLWGLVLAWPVGLGGWALWTLGFGGVLANVPSLAALAGVFAAAHVVFCLVALGHLPRVAREQQRAFEFAYGPMMAQYQHQLTQLRAQKSVLEAETT
jgi:hypothetical protein